MSQAKHTTGPWGHRNGRIFQIDRPELTIANVARSFDGDYSPSNGDLLAASAELLEALIVCCELIEGEGIEPPGNARAAIAKATGGE